MYKKNNFVFWVQSEEGLILQNVNTNLFLELNKVQERVWAYLDGTFDNDMIVSQLIQEFEKISSKKMKIIVDDTIKLLKSYDLINNGSI